MSALAIHINNKACFPFKVDFYCIIRRKKIRGFQRASTTIIKKQVCFRTKLNFSFFYYYYYYYYCNYQSNNERQEGLIRLPYIVASTQGRLAEQFSNIICKCSIILLLLVEYLQLFWNFQSKHSKLKKKKKKFYLSMHE